MKDYIWHGKQYQFDEGMAPADAVPVDEVALTPVKKVVETVKKVLEPKEKAVEQPKNKARETKKK